MNKPLRCCSCNKVLADEVSVQAGTIRITCRCGVVNEIKANLKEMVPYGERVEMVQKEGISYDQFVENVNRMHRCIVKK